MPASFWKWLVGFSAEVLGAILVAVLFDDEDDKNGRR
jgi:hypothetical protein